MAETYSARVESFKIPMQSDLTMLGWNGYGNSLITSSPAIGQSAIVPAYLSFFNRVGSNKAIKINKVTVNQIGATQGTETTMCGVTVSMLSAYAGGQVLYPIPLDTDNAVIPSQVLVSHMGYGTIGSTIRQLFLHTAMSTLPNGLPNGQSVGEGFSNRVTNRNSRDASFSNAYNYNHADANTQPITLREGQGICINYPAGSATPSPQPLEVSFELRIGSETYFFQELIHVNAVGVALGIFNGSGSGVVLEVLNIQTCETTRNTQMNLQSSTFPPYALITIDDHFGGTPVTPSAYDTNNAAVPSDIEILSGAAISFKMGGSIPSAIRPSGQLMRAPRQLAAFGLGTSNFWNVANTDILEHDINNTDSVFTLREGQGLAFLNSLYVSHQNLEIIFDFTVEDLGGASSEHSLTFIS